MAKLLPVVGALALALFGLAHAMTDEVDPLAGGAVQATTDVYIAEGAETGGLLLEPPPDGFVPWVSAQEAKEIAARYIGLLDHEPLVPVLALYSSAARPVDAEGRPMGPPLHQDVPVWYIEIPSDLVMTAAEAWYGQAGFDAEAAIAEGRVGSGYVVVDACSGEPGPAGFGVRSAGDAGELAVKVSHDVSDLSFDHDHHDPVCPTGHSWRPDWLGPAQG
jgi:hypothetical protein